MFRFHNSIYFYLIALRPFYFIFIKGTCTAINLFLFSNSQINFPMCTIASMPRLPEHCIEYARILQWPKEKPFGGMQKYSELPFKRLHLITLCYLIEKKCFFPAWSETSLDGDNPEHIQWVFERSQERAAEFNITGVTYRLTQGETTTFKTFSYSVLMCHLTIFFFFFAELMKLDWWSVSRVAGVVKRIIPAVASTNAVIAGMKLFFFSRFCQLCGECDRKTVN